MMTTGPPSGLQHTNNENGLLHSFTVTVRWPLTPPGAGTGASQCKETEAEMEALTAGGGGGRRGGARSGEVKVRAGKLSNDGVRVRRFGEGHRLRGARRGAGVRAAVVRPVRPLGASAAA